jgi:5-methylcytosine-specific restriction endonuclease McrA
MGLALLVLSRGRLHSRAEPNVRLEHRGEYPPDWQAIKDRVRAEAGGRCIRCGHPQGDRIISPNARNVASEYRVLSVMCTAHCTHPRDGKPRILTVHHLDGNKSNCKWWNLLALCQVCHLTIQGRVIPERAWLFHHSPWFVPFVCGFYASHYAQIEITREQADAEPARYLALGQPWLYEGDKPIARDVEQLPP